MPARMVRRRTEIGLIFAQVVSLQVFGRGVSVTLDGADIARLSASGFTRPCPSNDPPGVGQNDEEGDVPCESY